MKRLIRSNNKGQLHYNTLFNVFHVEFGNVEFKLCMDDFLQFERKIKEMSMDLSVFNASEQIKIKISDTGFSLTLTPEEMLSLRDLFGFKSEKLMSFKMKIDYSMN